MVDEPRGRDAIEVCAQSYAQRRGRDAREASLRPFIAASLTRATEWHIRNLARVRAVIGTSADLPPWTALEPWAREGLRQFFESMRRVEERLIEAAELEAQNEALRIRNTQLKDWRQRAVPGPPPPPPAMRRPVVNLDRLQRLDDAFPAHPDARPLWTSDPPMTLARAMLEVGHVALRRQRDHLPLGSSRAARLVAPIRACLKADTKDHTNDELLGLALVSATRVQQRAPLDAHCPKEEHIFPFIAEVERLHADLAGEDLADLWAVSVCATMSPREILTLTRSDLRRTWCRRLRKYRGAGEIGASAEDAIG